MQVAEFLAKRGSERCVELAQRSLLPMLKRLEDDFQYVSSDGKDCGINVRLRCEQYNGPRHQGKARLAVEEEHVHTCLAWWLALSLRDR